MENEYSIQTCYNSRTEYIFVADLDVHKYLDECGRVFHINSDFKHDVKLFNQNNAAIKMDRFSYLVGKYWGSASFCIQLIATPTKSDMPIFTPKDLEMFLMQRNCGDILGRANATDNGAHFTEADRKALITHAHAYLATKCTNIEKHHIDSVAKLLVIVVKKLADDTETGYTNVLRFLTKKVSNANYTKKAKTQAAVRPDETDLQSKLSVLKTMVVSNDNIDMIKSVLIDTAWRRSQMVKEAKLDFLEHFPVFYVHPELVLFDFANRFDSCDPNGFLENWPKYGSKIKSILKDSYNQAINTKWDDDVEQILMLLKILPGKATRKSNILPFMKAIDKLIVLLKVKPLQKELDKNIYPFIIACGGSYDQITHFYIAVENHLVSVPFEWNVMQVLDLFFKIHMVLDVDFEVNIAPAMAFIGHYLYGLKTKEFKPTLSISNLQAKFLPL